MIRRLPSGMSVRFLKDGLVKIYDPCGRRNLLLSPKEVEGLAGIFMASVLEKFQRGKIK